MTSAPILRSSALQKALALGPSVVRRPATGGTFATTLAAVQTNKVVQPRTAASRPATPPAPVSQALPALPGGTAIPYQSLITAAATKYGLDPALLAGVVKQESNFNPNATSPAGAKGLTQLMDATAKGLGVTDPYNPAQSLDAGARFLSGLMTEFHGDQTLAVAAYNAGPAAVKKYGGIPPYEETRTFVPKVLGYAAQFHRLLAEAPNASSTQLQK
jgi:soluble lytic murein transglycosylase-like protein